MVQEFSSLDNKQVLTATMSIAEFISGTRSVFTVTGSLSGQSVEQFKLAMTQDLIQHCQELGKRGIIDHKLATVALKDVAMTIKSEINRTNDRQWVDALIDISSCLYHQANKQEALSTLCAASAFLTAEDVALKSAVFASISEYLQGVQAIHGIQQAASLAIQHATSASFGANQDPALVAHMASWLTATLAQFPAERAIICLTVRPTAPAAIKQSLADMQRKEQPAVALAG